MTAYRARASARADAICSDPWAAKLAGDEGFELARRYDEVFPHMELWTAVRTAFIDARVRRALGPPWAMPQVVLLGAGFDTRAARLAASGTRFFEVDHADTQAEKLRRVGALEGYPRAAATHVACDFEGQDFLTELERAGFRPDAAALFVWEGVTPYLSEGAVRATLRRLAEGTAAGSVVVFDHLRKKIVAGNVADPNDLRSRDFVGDLGEPLRWGCDDVLPVLYAEGFRRVRTTSFDEACLDLTGTYERERKFRFQSLAVASRGAAELP
jgi:methyltransferase (TIGR00027 family)